MKDYGVPVHVESRDRKKVGGENDMMHPPHREHVGWVGWAVPCAVCASPHV